jgi:hypothetical protein
VAPTDLVTLSSFLGFAPQHIFYLVELADQMYFEFEIEKSAGGKRQISAPKTELKGVQVAILEKILRNQPVSDRAFAYVKGRSVVQATQELSGHKAVLHLDIENFFPTITRKRVFGFFRSIGYNNATSHILSRLCTLNGVVCQGAPTSPALSNLIFRKADKQLASVAHTFKISYIRYSDDLFFYADRNFRYERIANITNSILIENSFTLNEAKTKYHRRNSPRYTLGLQTVGKRPELSRKAKRNYRAAFFKASNALKWGAENLPQLSGMAEWYKAIYGRDDQYRDYARIIRNVRSIKLHEAFVIGSSPTT